MNDRWVRVSLAAAMTAALPVALSAQQSGPQFKQAQNASRTAKPKAQPKMDPALDEEEQISPSQVLQPPAEPAPEKSPRPAKANTVPAGTAPAQAKAAAAPSARSIACSGAFGKDSSHVKLAMVFGLQNIAFSEVAGPGGTKMMATVLFPKDPKRRLEVLWANEAARVQTALIDINGKSTWAAYKGLRIGLSLAAVEKLNGGTFKLNGFDKDGEASASDWMGGALLDIPGGCKVGVHFRPDAKAPADTRSAVSVDKEFASNDPAIVAVRPTVSEVLIGF